MQSSIQQVSALLKQFDGSCIKGLFKGRKANADLIPRPLAAVLAALTALGRPGRPAGLAAVSG